MSSKYCLEDAFFQSVGKLFSDVWVIHLRGRKQILAMRTPQIARKPSTYNFLYRYLNVTEIEKEMRGKRREKYRKTIILAHTRQNFTFAFPLEICKTSASEHCKLISRISDLQSQIL